MVAEGVGSDGVLSGQGHTAEDDEYQDKIGEDMMVDEGVASLPHSGEWGVGRGQNPELIEKARGMQLRPVVSDCAPHPPEPWLLPGPPPAPAPLAPPPPQHSRVGLAEAEEGTALRNGHHLLLGYNFL